MTDIQWDNYAKTLVGIRIHWVSEVTQVKQSGIVYLSTSQDYINNTVINDLPADTVMALNIGQKIEYEATISSVKSTIFGPEVDLNKPVILSIR